MTRQGSWNENQVLGNRGGRSRPIGSTYDATLDIERLAVDANVSGMSDIDVLMGQSLSTANTQTVTSSEASPGSPWVGAWEQTRDIGIVRVLTVLAATDTEIPGTFTFEFTDSSDPNTDHPTLGTAEISEARPIEDFDEVRDFDLLNAGAYYRVAFEPDNALGSESVFVTTTLRRQNDGQFVRLASQELEEGNAAFGNTFAYRKEFDPFTGKSVNVRPSARDAGNSSTTPLGSAAVFRGTWREVSRLGYVALIASVLADETGTLYVDLSNDPTPTDGDDTSVDKSLTITYGSDVVDTVVSRITPTQSRWVRLRFVNDATAQGTFEVEAQFTNIAPPLVLQQLDTVPTASNLAALVRAVQAGEMPDGQFQNVSVSGTLTLTPTPSALMGNADYTSDIFDMEGYASLRLAIATDQISDSNGVKIQWFEDSAGVTQVGQDVFTYTATQASAGFGAFPNVGMRSRYVRIVYENAGSAQSELFIVCRLNTVPVERRIDLGSMATGVNTRITGANTNTNALSFSTPNQRTIAFKAHPSNQSSVIITVGFSATGDNNWPLAPGDSVEMDVHEGVNTIYYRFGSTTSSPTLHIMAVGDPIP